MTTKENTRKSANRREFFLLAMVFSAPFIGAWLIYNFTNFGIDGQTSNYGELITPPRPTADVVLTEIVTGKTGHLHGKWTLIYWASDNCLSECQGNIRMLRNLKPALGTNSERLQTIVARENASTAALTDKLGDNFSWNGIFILNYKDLQASIESSESGNGTVLTPGFYLLDPMGNMMMRYKLGSEGAGILGDIKRLLRYSRTG